jgi:NAD(P) transhydrogenase
MTQFDVIIIGGGPGGHSAAISAAQADLNVLLIEREQEVGGACVSHGTIPSKTLRETAAALTGFKRRTGSVFGVEMRDDLQLESLMARKEAVIRAHQNTMGHELAEIGVTRWHGRARFTANDTIAVEGVDRSVRDATARVIVIATGSRPRNPPGIEVDHTTILDSDSFLSLTYLPRTLGVLGGGVIASEYASVFAALGVQVTMIDKYERPLGFLDTALTDRFVSAFSAAGGSRFIGGRTPVSASFDGICNVITTLDDGSTLESEKLLCALGRVANLDRLGLDKAGLAPTDRGILAVNPHFQTSVPGIYAIGDVIGPPSLASAALDQGRRAIAHAFGLSEGNPPETTPMGIYTIPELAAVGLTEDQARKKHGDCRCSVVSFADIARGQIAANQDGLLKMVADADGKRLLGVHIAGETAAELVHLGQMALLAKWSVDDFVATTFNFPTHAEAYRVAALDLIHQRRSAKAASGTSV